MREKNKRHGLCNSIIKLKKLKLTYIMKKLIFSFVLLFAAQGIFAQLDWSLLNKKYEEVYKLAEMVSYQTGKVTVSEDEKTHIGIERSANVIVFLDRKLDDDRVTQGKFYRYYLGSTDRETKSLLDKENTEKVLEKFHELLSSLKAKLDEDRDTQVDDLLNSLFSAF